MNTLSPILTEETESHFLSSKQIMVREAILENKEQVKIAPLKIIFNRSIEILRMSITKKMISYNYDLNMAEIDPSTVSIRKLYFEINNDISYLAITPNTIGFKSTIIEVDPDKGIWEKGKLFSFSLEINPKDLGFNLLPLTLLDQKYWFCGDFFLNSESGHGIWTYPKDHSDLNMEGPWGVNKPVGFDIDFALSFDTLNENRYPKPADVKEPLKLYPRTPSDRRIYPQPKKEDKRSKR